MYNASMGSRNNCNKYTNLKARTTSAKLSLHKRNHITSIYHDRSQVLCKQETLTIVKEIFAKQQYLFLNILTRRYDVDSKPLLRFLDSN